MDNTSHKYNAGKCSLTYEELTEKTGVPREVWAERIWETVDERDLMFVRPTSEQGEGLCNTKNLHLPAEFPEGELDASPNDKTEEKAVACRHHDAVLRWQYKSHAVYPVDYHDICRFCLYEFEQWWDNNARDAPVWGGVHD